MSILLKKNKKIVFVVNASTKIGLGHLFRSITIAKYFKLHKILFLIKTKPFYYYKKLNTNFDYKIYKNTQDLVATIKKINPNIVVNDKLDNSKYYMKQLIKNNNIVINIEDQGTGRYLADYLIDELNFNYKTSYAKQYLFGYKYFLLRNEFDKKNKIKFRKKIKNILLIFGGTDPKNYNSIVLDQLVDFCYKNEIIINVAKGIGNKKIESNLRKLNNKYSTIINKISDSKKLVEIMSICDFAITSNGRTVLELAHMNIPSIVLYQNNRESKHDFWRISKGSIVLGFINKQESLILKTFKGVFNNNKTRRSLYNNLLKYKFNKNKKRFKSLFDKILNEI